MKLRWWLAKTAPLVVELELLSVYYEESICETEAAWCELTEARCCCEAADKGIGSAEPPYCALAAPAAAGGAAGAASAAGAAVAAVAVGHTSVNR